MKQAGPIKILLHSNSVIIVFLPGINIRPIRVFLFLLPIFGYTSFACRFILFIKRNVTSRYVGIVVSISS